MIISTIVTYRLSLNADFLFEAEPFFFLTGNEDFSDKFVEFPSFVLDIFGNDSMELELLVAPVVSFLYSVSWYL